MDEASEGRTREYVTASSKRVADAVEAAIVEKHGPDASEHPPNNFNLWGEATGGGRKVLQTCIFIVLDTSVICIFVPEPINLAGLSLLHYAVLGCSSQFFDYAFSQMRKDNVDDH
ncbi:hypothetical protein Tco_1462105 [Tanacetum coccineum]